MRGGGLRWGQRGPPAGQPSPSNSNFAPSSASPQPPAGGAWANIPGVHTAAPPWLGGAFGHGHPFATSMQGLSPGITPARVIDAMLGFRRPAFGPRSPGPPPSWVPASRAPEAEPCRAPAGASEPNSAPAGKSSGRAKSEPDDVAGVESPGTGPAPQRVESEGPQPVPPIADGEAPPPAPPAFAEPQDCYKVLEADRFADELEIKKCYRKLVLQWHPDKHPANREQAEEKIRHINNAYETLGNPMKRSAYDQMLLALDRKRNGVRLETSTIKPRMSIPKEFMLCPLGHPDKFVRVVGLSVQAQSRHDTRCMDFKTFFQLSKFSLWWLPEVNNMCRLRVQESASQGVGGGLNFNFMLEGKTQGVPDADVVLSANQDPRYANLVAVASPFSPGAFRFEGAFWPGHYLSFRPPSTIRMAGLVDEANDIVDFVLVDFAAMYRYMTMDEVLAPAVQTHAGNVSEFVKLSDMRADLSVRTYFQSTLGCPVWNNRDFEAYFEGHFDIFDFDAKRARVRVRPKEQQLAKRLQQTEQPSEVAELVLNAGSELLGQLPPAAAAWALNRLNAGVPAERGTSPVAAAAHQRSLASAKLRLLSVMPSICSSASKSDTSLASLIDLHHASRTSSYPLQDAEADGSRAGTCSRNGSAPEDSGAAQVATVLAVADESMAALVVERLTQLPGELELALLPKLLSLGIDWQSAAGASLHKLVTPLLDVPSPPGALLEPLRAALRLGDGAKPLAEAIARRELSRLSIAEDRVAVQVLTTLADEGVLLDDVIVAMQPAMLQRLPLPDLATLLASVIERWHNNAAGTAEGALQPGIEALVAAPSAMASLPTQLILRLAVLTTKSSMVADVCLGPLATAAAETISAWPLDDVAKLMLAVAKSRATSTSFGVQCLFAKATDFIIPQLSNLSAQQLLKLILAAGATPQCKALLEAAAKEAQLRLSDFRPAQLLVLTHGLLPLGGQHQVMAQVLDFWEQLLRDGAEPTNEDACAASRRRVELEGQARLQPDQVARLAQLLAPITPEHVALFDALGAAILKGMGALTEGGKASLEAAFPSGAGPEFPCKARLLRKMAEGSRPQEGTQEKQQIAPRKESRPVKDDSKSDSARRKDKCRKDEESQKCSTTRAEGDRKKEHKSMKSDDREREKCGRRRQDKSKRDRSPSTTEERKRRKGKA